MIRYHERLPRHAAAALTPDDLRAYRVNVLHMSQNALASYLGVQPVSVSRWELGKVPMPAMLPYALLGIAAALTSPPSP